jgi:hypothetical protein
MGKRGEGETEGGRWGIGQEEARPNAVRGKVA